MKKLLAIITILTIAFSSLTGCVNTEEMQPKEDVQEAMSNFNSKGKFCVDGEYIYAASTEGLVKMKLDGSDYQVLVEGGTPCFIHVADDSLYFILMTDDSTGVYRCELDGSNLERIVEQDAYYLQIVGDKMYYNKFHMGTGQTTGFYKANLDGKSEKSILVHELYDTFVVGDVLFYQNKNSDETMNRYQMVTERHEGLTSGISYSFVTDGISGYYVKNDKSMEDGDYVGDVMKVDFKTKEETLLFEGADVQTLVLKGDSIYFVNANDEGRIYCMSKEGEGAKKIVDETNCMNLAVYGDSLFYYDYNEDLTSVEGVYKADLDGNNKISLEGK